jgi:hypothetical protein
LIVFWGGTPPRPPWVGFAEVWAAKQRFLLRASPQTPWVGFAEFWAANQPSSSTLFASFLEKEEYNQLL